MVQDMIIISRLDVGSLQKTINVNIITAIILRSEDYNEAEI